MTGTDSV